jgi:hypothetical protein
MTTKWGIICSKVNTGKARNSSLNRTTQLKDKTVNLNNNIFRANFPHMKRIENKLLQNRTKISINLSRNYR